MIAGRYGASGTVRVEGGLAPLLQCFRAIGIPELILAACSVYAARSDDALSIIIPLAWCVQRETVGEVMIISHQLPKTEVIGDLPAYAFDPLHTRHGRTALALWLRSYPTKLPWNPRAVALSLWNQEAALCARTSGWPVGEELHQRAFRADLISCGLPETEHAGLDAWVEHEMPALNRARRQVWNHPRPLPAGTPPQQGTLPLEEFDASYLKS